MPIDKKQRAADSLTKWRLANPEKVRVQQRRARENIAADPLRKEKRAELLRQYNQIKVQKRAVDPAATMLSAARQRAKKKNGICTLNIDHIHAVMNTKCPVFGTDYEIKRGSSWSRTLDKIIPELWYTPENIIVLSARANLIKQNANSAQLIQLADNIAQFENSKKNVVIPGPLDNLVITKGARGMRRRYKTELFQSARLRAKREGIEFSMTLDDIFIPEFCPYLNIKLERNVGHGGAFSSPSIDRINPKLGYVTKNVLVVSYVANRMKQDATSGEILTVGNWLKSACEKVLRPQKPTNIT